MTYFTSANQAAIIAAEAQISSNSRLPNISGTLRWAIPQQSVDLSMWFIPMPSISGWGNVVPFTQEQMLASVDMTDIIEQEYTASWFPLSDWV